MNSRKLPDGGVLYDETDGTTTISKWRGGLRCADFGYDRLE